jgi:hypothetical protein
MLFRLGLPIDVATKPALARDKADKEVTVGKSEWIRTRLLYGGHCPRVYRLLNFEMLAMVVCG